MSAESDYQRTWPRPRSRCPDCGEEVVLRWGDTRRPHFAHVPGHQGEETARCSGGEGALHYLAKSMVADRLRFGSDMWVRTTCSQCGREKSEKISGSAGGSVQVEYGLESGAVADVAVIKDNCVALVIEIMNSNRASTNPRVSCPWYELDAADVVSSAGPDVASVPELACKRQDRHACSHPLCLPLIKIADRLGYCFLNQHYWSARARERNAAVRGKYMAPCWDWCNTGFDKEDAPRNAHALWGEVVRRGKCVRCDKNHETPFCLTCYKYACQDHDPQWVEISREIRQALLMKHRWLDEVPKTRGHEDCAYHEGGCDCVTPYIFWFGNRRMCECCFERISAEKSRSQDWDFWDIKHPSDGEVWVRTV